VSAEKTGLAEADYRRVEKGGERVGLRISPIRDEPPCRTSFPGAAAGEGGDLVQ